VRLTTGVLLWFVAAAAATAVGLAAVAAIGTDIFGGGRDPLSQSEVDELLRSRPPAPATAATTSPSSPPPSSSSLPSPPPSSAGSTPPLAPAETAIPTAGGTVIAACTADGLVRVSASPAQGYRLDSDDDVDDHPSVKFRSGDHEIEVRLRCADGIPIPEIQEDD
jgi:hypothetical protein